MGDGVYCVTAAGFVLKRLDQIITSIYDYISQPEPTGWGIDPRIVDGTDNQNLQSALNVLVTGFANEVSSLWEVALDTYNSAYPNTANDISLDNVVQFGGVERGQDRVSIYPLLCTGDDETSIPYGSLVQSTIAPVQQLQASSNQTISIDSFVSVLFGVLSVVVDDVYSIQINGTTYSYTAQAGDDATDILTEIKDDIIAQTSTAFDMVIDATPSLRITDANKSSNTLVISANLEVLEVSSRLYFETLNYGDIQIPLNTITSIVSSRDGWTSVTNDVAYIAGQTKEDDTTLRQKYTEEVGGNAEGTVTATVAAIKKLDGVVDAIGFRNNDDTTNTLGMAPHSLWFVVDGGDDGSIAQVIFTKGGGGINTNGNTVVSVIDEFGNAQPTRFDRPTTKYAWLHVELTAKSGKSLPSNYEALTKSTILAWVAKNVKMGNSVYIQQCYNDIYTAVANLALVNITAELTDTLSAPGSYTLTNIILTQSQKAVFSVAGSGVDQIEVALI